MQEITFEDYISVGPLTGLDVVKEITGSQKVNIVGYCIGGTLLAMVLSFFTALGDKNANSATFFVSLLDFREVGDTAVFIDEPQGAYIEGEMMERGYLDSRSMAAIFTKMRAHDIVL